MSMDASERGQCERRGLSQLIWSLRPLAECEIVAMGVIEPTDAWIFSFYAPDRTGLVERDDADIPVTSRLPHPGRGPSA